MSRLNKAILAMFFAGISVSQMNAVEKKKLEKIYKLNVLQYIPHVTSPDNAREVTANFEQLSTEAGETIEMSHINTFPIRNAADAELFPNLQTQELFNIEDYLVPDIEFANVNFTVSAAGLYQLVEGNKQEHCIKKRISRTISHEIKFTLETIGNQKYFGISKTGNDVSGKPTLAKFMKVTANCTMSEDGALKTQIYNQFLDDYIKVNFSDIQQRIMNNMYLNKETSKCPISRDRFFVKLNLSNKSNNLNTLIIPEEVEELHLKNPLMRSNLQPTWQTIKFNHKKSRLKKIGASVFNSCNNIHMIHIPNSVQEIGYGAFSYSENLHTVILPDMLKTYREDMMRWCNSLRFLAIPDGFNAYYECIPGFGGPLQLDGLVYLVSNGKITKTVYMRVDNEGEFLNQLKVYKKSDVIITENEDGTFVANAKDGVESVLERLENIKNRVLIIPEGIEILDKDSSIETLKMQNASSLKLPSTLKSISVETFHGNKECIPTIPATIKNVFAPITIQKMSIGLFKRSSVNTVTIYGNGSELDKKVARDIVRGAGFKGKIEFVDNI